MFGRVGILGAVNSGLEFKLEGRPKPQRCKENARDSFLSSLSFSLFGFLFLGSMRRGLGTAEA